MKAFRKMCPPKRSKFRPTVQNKLKTLRKVIQHIKEHTSELEKLRTEDTILRGKKNSLKEKKSLQ